MKMRNVLSGIVDVCRVLALLILAICAVGVGYLSLVTRLPAAVTPVAATEKIGPTFARAPAPIATAAVRSASAGETPAARPAVPIKPAAASVSNDAVSFGSASGRTARDARVQTASLETGTLSDASEEPAHRAQQARRGGKRVAGAAGCENFRSFDPVTQTYRAYNGRIRECRVR